MVSNKKNAQLSNEQVSLIKLFQFATTSEKWKILIGSILSFINGFMQPLFGIFFGDVVNGYRNGNSLDEIVESIGLVSLRFVIVGCCSFFISLCMFYCWINVGESQAINIRIAYFKSLLVQEPGYFDTLNCTELSSKVAQDCQKVQKAIGEKLCMYIYIMSMIFGSIVLSFIKGWIIALVCLAMLPLMIATNFFLTWVQNGVRSKTSEVYLEAGGRVEQALNSIRTVKSLAGEEHELDKYTSLLHRAYKVAFSYSMFTGIGLGLRNFVVFLNFSVTLWIGSTLIESKIFNDCTQSDYTYSEILSAFLAFLNTSFQIGQATESMKAFNEARVAGFSLFEVTIHRISFHSVQGSNYDNLMKEGVIDRNPKISDNYRKGLECEGKSEFDLKGAEIKFDSVTFAYPTNPNQNITQDLSFTVRPHKCTAIIGSSGSGKSTIVALLERFYDPISGSIQINGVDIKDIPLTNLRRSIGYVSQEPVLFAATIRENLLYALPTATEEQMIEALIQANIWDFVSSLPGKLDSFVGQNALQLSGGQKQRICIARSILKKPSIFLFDEATSALDIQSEKIVQSTIDRLAQTCTTIIVAHRLSTIRNVDEIIVMDKGKIVESGSYSELLHKNGYFTRFVLAQEEIQQDSKIPNKESKLEDQQELQQQYASRREIQQWTQLNIPTEAEINNQIHQITEVNFQTEQTDEQHNLQHNNYSQQLNTQKGLISKENYSHSVTDFSSKDTITSRSAIEGTSLKKSERSFWQIVKIWYAYNPQQTMKAVLGIMFAFMSGFSYPLVGLVLGHISETLLFEKEGFKEESDRYCMYFAIIAVYIFVTMSLQYYFQSQISQALTFALRRDLFKKFLRMPINWFDLPKNNSANLSLAIAADTSSVNVLVSTVITFSVQNISTLTSGIVLALVSEWKTALIGISIIPVLFAINIYYSKKMSIFIRGVAKSSENTAILVNETAYYIRTVASLSNNHKFIETFSRNLNGNRVMIKKTAFEAGFSIGLDQLARFCCYGGIFYFGVLFMRADGGGSPAGTMSAIVCLLLASSSVGKNMEYMGDAGLAINCSKRILDFLETEDEKIEKLEKQIKDVKGEIIFENVTFKYPERNVPVLKNVSFNIPANSKVAFVGASGSGKSSILQLIQRFYSDYTGRILIDGIDLKELNLTQLRSKVLGVVQQEPVLFFGSIKDNIVYNTKSVTESDILNAVEQVHIMELINQSSKSTQNGTQNMIEGFERQIGARGVQISGGQKQRIAIARMILKKPKIILLDEATSALDSQNEKKVQQSLDKILENRTSITVAHRISTIQQSDRIYVLSDGEIVEEGNYHALMENKSHFFNMQQKVEQIPS